MEKSSKDNTFILLIKIANIGIINVYKPTGVKWKQQPLKLYAHPSICIADFNSHSTSWGYNEDYENSTILTSWIEINDLVFGI